MEYKPFPHQEYSTNHIINNACAGAILSMGKGKTISTLTAIDQLMNYYMRVESVLIVAPKKVAEITWPQEIAYWDHIQHMTYSLIAGDERSRKLALMKKADIHIVGVDNLVWLISQYGGDFLPYDMLVIDESSLFKNHKSKRFEALRKVLPLIKRRVILTGTPSPNGLIDLWAQMYILDRGERLGTTITGYRERFFVPEKMQGFTVFKYKIRPEMEDKIYKLIGDICFSIHNNDHLDIPETIYNTIHVHMPPDIRRQYDEFEEFQVHQIQQTGEDISPVNAAALNNKLTQFANGALYDSEKTWHLVHDAKIDALKDIIAVSQGAPILVLYWYQSDRERLLKAFPQAVQLKGKKEVDAWNNGEIDIALMHPASGGHGLNLQHGGHIGVWFGLTWDLQLYLQACARLPRPGQRNQVIWHHLVCVGTMDEDIMRAIKNKDADQSALIEAIKVRFEKFSKNIW